MSETSSPRQQRASETARTNSDEKGQGNGNVGKWDSLSVSETFPPSTIILICKTHLITHGTHIAEVPCLTRTVINGEASFIVLHAHIDSTPATARHGRARV